VWSVCLCAPACPVSVSCSSRLPPVSFYRPLSRPLIRSSRGRSGALVGWVGCEVRLCVRVNLKQDHTVQRRSCRRVPGGARLHDHWQQASKRGAAKEVRFPGFRPDGDGERRADHGGERDEAQVVREEGGGGRA